jgi:hypothetical protein
MRNGPKIPGPPTIDEVLTVARSCGWTLSDEEAAVLMPALERVRRLAASARSWALPDMPWVGSTRGSFDEPLDGRT